MRSHRITDGASGGRILCGILVCAAVLRIIPIWFGLPHMHARPDEGAAIGHAVAILEGDPNPHFFHWPSLIFYLFAGIFAAASAVRGAITGEAALTAVEQMLIGRATVGLAGTATVLVLFTMARRIAGTHAGLIAAALLSVAILHVRDSHFAMTDVVMTLLLTGSLALLLEALDEAQRTSQSRVALRPFAAAGLVGGLAASTKYSAAAVAAAMAAGQLLLFVRRYLRPSHPGGWGPSAAFAVALGAGFLAATPYAVLDFATFWSDLRLDVAHLSEGHGTNLGRGWIYHATRSLPYGLGPLTFAAVIAGAVPFVRRHLPEAFVLGTFAAAFYLAIGSGYTVFFRYVLPLLPILCLMAAVGVVAAGRWLAARSGIRPAAAVGLLAAIVAAQAAVNAVCFDVLLARTDTRVLAARWLAPRVQPGDTLYDSGGDYSTLDLGRTAYHQWFFKQESASFGHPEGHTPDWLVLHQSPLRTYGRHPALVRRLAESQYDLVAEFRATRGAASSAVYDLQDAFFMPFSAFGTVVRPGPTILIYQRRSD